MERNQHITVPKHDTRRVETSITDVSGENSDGPTNLTGKTVRWRLFKHSLANDPVFDYTNDDAKLSIEGDPVDGVVSLHLDSTETIPAYDNYRHYFYVEEGDDQWTTTTGLLKINQS